MGPCRFRSATDSIPPSRSPAAPFLPRLIPELEKVKEEVADPECRQVAGKAYATLMRVGGEGKVAAIQPYCTKKAGEMLKETCPKASTLDADVLEFVSAIVGRIVSVCVCVCVGGWGVLFARVVSSPSSTFAVCACRCRARAAAAVSELCSSLPVLCSSELCSSLPVLCSTGVLSLRLELTSLFLKHTDRPQALRH